MKKTAVLVLAGILCLSLSGCGKSEVEKKQEEVAENVSNAMNELKDANDKIAEIQKDNEKKFNEEQKSIDNAVLEIDSEYFSSKLTLKSYVIIPNEYIPDEKILVLTMDYINTDDQDWHFGVFKDAMRLYQDGAVLNEYGITGFEKDTFTSIKNGATIEVVYSYKLRNETSDVEFEVNNETAYTLKIK